MDSELMFYVVVNDFKMVGVYYTYAEALKVVEETAFQLFSGRGKIQIYESFGKRDIKLYSEWKN